MTNATFKTLVYTSLAIAAFAGNSILCRLALHEQAIDAGSFTVIRLLSGIIALLLLVRLLHSNNDPINYNNSITGKGSNFAAAMLFLYMVSFSYAYLSLNTGTGALILFGSVQISMILFSLIKGTRLHALEWLGLIMAFAGFVYLVKPILTTPSLIGFILMTISGIAWAFYTLQGRHSANPLSDTAINFLRGAPYAVLLAILLVLTTDITSGLSAKGVLLAVASGAITSGAGYAIWYAALGGLSTTQAAVVQLLVPVVAALGGVIFANEILSRQLVIAAILVLGGILLVVLGHRYVSQPR